MQRGRSENTTKVFVGSLPAGIAPDDLRKLFEPYGPIAECDISNKCGFLHLEDGNLANKAIDELNGTDFMGSRISVERGRVKPRRGGGGGPVRGSGRGGDRGTPYSRGGPPRDFRGQRGGFGGRGGFRGRGGYEDRRGGGGYPSQERAYDPYEDRGAYGDGPRGYDDRRPGPPARGPPADDLYSRREEMPPKPMGGSSNNYDRYGGGGGGGGYNSSYYGGGSSSSAGGYSGGGAYSDRSYGGGGGYSSTGYGPSSSTGYGGSSGYDDGYGAPPPRGGYEAQQPRGGYEAAYPPLPAQRSYGSGSGGGAGRGGAPRRY